MRATLLASATAASFGGLRATRFRNQGEGLTLSLRTCSITEVAPTVMVRRKAWSPARVTTPSRILPAVEWYF